MHEFIIQAIERGGYLGIALLMAIENIFPPIPSEIIMGIGGLAVARGTMEFWPLLLAGTLGSTAGNYVWFWAGDKWGFERLGPFIDRWGRWLTLDWQHVESASAFFRRRGEWMVFFLRFSPFLRTMISLPAGLAHMPVWRFLIFTFLGSALWNILLVLGGQWLGQYLEEYKSLIGWIIFALIGIAIVAYAYRVLTWTPRGRDD
ncbi:DedA family protein [Altererythrobacter sp. SALINAS58]|uniref:DedA family protein n=1 Tax=Alteripontixanthobacter muriae TaxID=2705546 RepID=UPI0015766544|nr:DedA family protein [Alteripontixanthobacter muriae]NTZ41813.1 DedA family protein [Alteripontixanthobacter muriae]